MITLFLVLGIAAAQDPSEPSVPPDTNEGVVNGGAPPETNQDTDNRTQNGATENQPPFRNGDQPTAGVRVKRQISNETAPPPIQETTTVPIDGERQTNIPAGSGFELPLSIASIILALIAGIIGVKNMGKKRELAAIKGDLQQVQAEITDLMEKYQVLRGQAEKIVGHLNELKTKERQLKVEQTIVQEETETRQAQTTEADHVNRESDAVEKKLATEAVDATEVTQDAPVAPTPTNRGMNLGVKRDTPKTPINLPEVCQSAKNLFHRFLGAIDAMGEHSAHFKASVINNLDFYANEFTSINDETLDTLALPLLDGLIEFYSITARYAADSQDFENLHSGLDKLIFTYFNDQFEAQGWGRIINDVPFETELDYDVHNVVATETVDGYDNVITNIQRIGLARGNDVVRKSEVTIGES